MARLEGKVALISGGARGQGAAEARLFAQEGAKVVIGDVLDEAGMKVEAEIRELGGEAAYVHLDVTREDDWISASDGGLSNSSMMALTNQWMRAVSALASPWRS